MIRVVLVDSSAESRRALRTALEADADLLVIGEAGGAAEALKLVTRLKPDLVAMDVQLPGESGVQVAAALMKASPRPILLLTETKPDATLISRAMEAGALEVAAKLPSTATPGYEPSRQKLLRLFKALAGVPVVHRFDRRPREAGAAAVTRQVEPFRAPEIVLIGASTGGPPVVGSILKQVRSLTVPVAVVQHMAAGFMEGFVQWLARSSGHPVVLVDRAVSLVAGTIYIAPDDRHLVVGDRRTVAPQDGPERNFQRPSVDELFESAARSFGGDAVAVLLTGMGRDGAAGMLALKKAGALTIAQDPETCAVGAMPRSAIERNAAVRVASPDDIASALIACSGAMRCRHAWGTARGPATEE